MTRTTTGNLLLRMGTAAQSRTAQLAHRRERGDVPGWVLVTLMTALLVVALLAIARPQLTAILSRALNMVN